MRRTTWVFALLAIVAGIVVSILWIDLPLARFLVTFGLPHRVFTNPGLTLPLLTTLAWAGLLTGLGFLLRGKTMPRPVEAGMLASIALLVGSALTHDLLKPLFGRTVPSLYLGAHHTEVQWFHRGKVIGSFPSGHATQLAAMLVVAWAWYPRGRWAYAGGFLLLALALLLGRWHYLSDILAGGLVGGLVAAATLSLWRKLRTRWPRVLGGAGIAGDTSRT